MAATKVTPARLTRTLSTVAAEIYDDYAAQGKPVFYAAAPYLEALSTMDTFDLSDMYYMDKADTLVIYLLENLNTWRGETARRVKAELKAALADYRLNSGRGAR